MYLVGAIVCFFLAHVINQRWKGAWYFVIPLGLLGALCIAASEAGMWITHTVLMPLANGLASAINALFALGLSGAMIMGTVALIGTIIIVLDVVKDHTYNRTALIAFVFTPLAALGTGGAIGDLHASIRDAGSSMATSVVSTLIG